MGEPDQERAGSARRHPRAVAALLYEPLVLKARLLVSGETTSRSPQLQGPLELSPTSWNEPPQVLRDHATVGEPTRAVAKNVLQRETHHFVPSRSQKGQKSGFSRDFNPLEKGGAA